MKVMIVNGSSHENGTTMVAINEMIKVFDEEGVETEVIQLGSKPIPDCLQCNYCVKNGRCVFDDEVNEFVEKAADADGFVFASPVYYAHPSGRLYSFLDRVFFSSSCADGSAAFRFKPGAAIAVARRGGTSATYHHNLFAHNNSRTPLVNGARGKDPGQDLTVYWEFINNVNYNWGSKMSTYGGENESQDPDYYGFKGNFVNNYYKPGPATLAKYKKDELKFFRQSGICFSSGAERENCSIGCPCFRGDIPTIRVGKGSSPQNLHYCPGKRRDCDR